ncbi:MAG: 4-alpha-glucanotransferase [Christensenellales bacterium]|jgi:4-alpha-glucanotransferase|nr:4-alpha-glucanotransferase [Clostridiales bacterium]
MRQSGILLHITSLPGREGIGTLGREARGFVDFLVKAGMSIWQVLPISPTGYAESPYQCFSTYAGNPLLIDLYTLKRQGILKSEALPPASDEPELIDYAPIIEYKNQMLGLAFTQSYKKLKKKVDAFRAENALWIEDFALFMAIKKHFGGISWQEWPDEAIRMRKARALREYQKELKEQIDLEVFIQYLFFEQWFALKAYANERGIRIFGDMPIYVAEDSADAWANPAVFQLDKHRRPVKIAGVPPDYFAVDGQRWGNPLYDWRYLKRTGFEWWINRLRAMARIFDITRVDHFIGFANYYAVPADEDTARNGVWVTGPGRAFFDAVKRELPGMNIVAEDLGAVSPRVRRLLDDTGYPGMKVMTFAFSGDPYNEHLPKYHEKNSLVYTGTHDNNTLLGWWANAPTHERNNALLALGIRHDEELTEAFIKATLNSVANTAIIPMQDVLRLGASARMNLPGSVGGNWQWRMKPKATSNKVAAWIYQLNEESGRLPEKDLPF